MENFDQIIYLFVHHMSLHEPTIVQNIYTQIVRFIWPTWDPPRSCRPQVGPMSAPWTLLSGYSRTGLTQQILTLEVSRDFTWPCRLFWLASSGP